MVPRAGLGASWWPPVWRERFGFGADVRAATSLDIASPSFVGSFDETLLGLWARTRFGSGTVSIEIAAGSSLHVTSLSGTAPATKRSASIGRADPSLDLAAIPELALSTRVRLGLLLGASAMLRYQRYTLGDETLLRMPPVGLDLGGRVLLALD
jgi:hypothetical protein